ncbi:MAG: NUDIX domain-containing protein [Calditrichaeota bacterium]|nr:MAG: NUDIX domain-containing protein [Calditrichota bacterium]
MKMRACLVILKNQREILLIRRKKGENEYWVFPGGGVEAGETATEAAVREAQEELSLDISPGPVLFELTNLGRKEIYFLVKKYSGTIALGSGPERKRQNQTNMYEFHWIAQEAVQDINLKPSVAVLKLLQCELSKWR